MKEVYICIELSKRFCHFFSSLEQNKKQMEIENSPMLGITTVCSVKVQDKIEVAGIWWYLGEG